MSDPLTLVASITSDQVHDPDDVPMHEDGNCRFWGAWPESPIPNIRVFAVFNREPVDETEAYATAKEWLNPDDDDD